MPKDTAAPSEKKLSPEDLDKTDQSEQPEQGSPLTDAHRVTILSQQLNHARITVYGLLQKVAAKKVEADGISWDQATGFIQGQAQGFDAALAAIDHQLTEQMLAAVPVEGHA